MTNNVSDPALDPPMTIRIHPDDDPASATARRVIKTDDRSTPVHVIGEEDGASTMLPPSWYLVTGHPEDGRYTDLLPAYFDEDLPGWPIVTTWPNLR